MHTLPLIELVLVILVLAYTPVAAWRGGLREGLLGGGLVVTGALIIAPPVDLLQESAQERGVYGRLLVAAACLGVGLAIGIGAGRVIERHGASPRGRLFGAFCGLANAQWVATFLLVELEQTSKLSGLGGSLADMVVLGPLVTHHEITLLALSTTVLVVSGFWTVYLLWVRLGSAADQNLHWTPRPGTVARHRTVRVPSRADSGKVEPIGSGTSLRLSSTIVVGPNAVARRFQEDRRNRSRPHGGGERRTDATGNQRTPSAFWYSLKPSLDARTPRDDS